MALDTLLFMVIVNNNIRHKTGIVHGEFSIFFYMWDYALRCKISGVSCLSKDSILNEKFK